MEGVREELANGLLLLLFCLRVCVARRVCRSLSWEAGLDLARCWPARGCCFSCAVVWFSNCFFFAVRNAADLTLWCPSNADELFSSGVLLQATTCVC